MSDLGDDLCSFLDLSPSPTHAVLEMVRRLVAAGFAPLDERDTWVLAPGDARYVVRDGGSLVAFRIGSAPLADAGVRLVGTHTDSPTFKVRPRSDVARAGYRLVGVEPYGGMLAHTWLDRELTVAGRVAVRASGSGDGSDSGDGSGSGDVELRPVVLTGAPLRIPSLAIHLDRSVRDGLVLDPQRHLVPIWSGDLGVEPGLIEALADLVGCDAGDVLGHDLVLTDAQPAARTGADGSWVAGPRLDDLGCCHSALLALLSATSGERTQLLVANDHEEVGSGSAEGARGSFLGDVLHRLVVATGDAEPQAVHRAAARSRLVSADMAHAVHPNYAERHEPAHTPRLGGGPVLKLNANQSYATDAGSGGWFTSRCDAVGVPVQHFASRADLPCGSTIGPLTATRLGISTVDVGAPMLAMHSCRELASGDDVPLMVAALRSCLEG